MILLFIAMKLTILILTTLMNVLIFIKMIIKIE